MCDVGQQLFVGVRSAPVQKHLDAVARSRPGTEYADGPRNDEVARRQVVIRAVLAEALDLRLELLYPRRALDHLVVETAERHRRRTDVSASVFQLIEGVD